MRDGRHSKGARHQRGQRLPASAARFEVATGDPPRILMDKLDRLLNEFVEAWNAGRRPEVDDYVERAPEAERNELAGLIGAFLEIAPTPPYSPEQLDALRRDPIVLAIGRLAEDEPGPTPLPRLRERAKLKRDQVVEALARALGFPEKQTKIRRYYHQLEVGTITP